MNCDSAGAGEKEGADDQAGILPAGLSLTEEQRAVCSVCTPPANGTQGQLVRITAGAGAGKTTCLLALGAEAVAKGHTEVVCVAFTKSAARDGKRRLEDLFNKSVENHYQDRALSVNEYEEARTYLKSGLWSITKFEKWISELCNDAIEKFLAECYREIEQTTEPEKVLTKKRRARRKVEELILKTLLKQFCDKKCSVEEFEDRSNKRRMYYAAQLFHTEKDKKKSGKPVRVKLGFVGDRYEKKETAQWYADQACFVWGLITQKGIRTYDIVMKKAQLLHLRMPGTILLVDEAQDMTECQVGWVTEQINFGTHVYVVGDAAQSIYSFRGARSKYLMDLNPDKDLQLTASFRFGHDIAAVANCVLFAKNKSPQSVEKWVFPLRDYRHKYWIPYRVSVGNPSLAGRVTKGSLLDMWHSRKPVTLLARSNAMLFEEIVRLLTPEVGADLVQRTRKAVPVTQDSDEIEKNQHDKVSDIEYSESESEESDLGEEDSESELAGDSKMKAVTCDEKPYPVRLPKIHINSGKTSGRLGFKTAFAQVDHLFHLFALQPGGKKRLPKKLFPDFEGMSVSWDEFLTDCKDFKYTKFSVATGIILAFKSKTMEAVRMFQEYVMDRTFSAEETDIILTTCHSAKGMEWNYVHVCDDFGSLCQFDKKGVAYRMDFLGQRLKLDDKHRQFSFTEYNDNINLLYVACTRAKQELSVPPGFWEMLNDFDSVYSWILENEGSTVAPVFIRDVRLNGAQLENQEAPSFHKDLVEPLRIEQGLSNGQMLFDAIFRDEVNGSCTSPPATRIVKSSNTTSATRLVSPQPKQQKRRPRKGGNHLSKTSAKRPKVESKQTISAKGLHRYFPSLRSTKAKAVGRHTSGVLEISPESRKVTPEKPGSSVAAQTAWPVAPKNLFFGSMGQKSRPVRSLTGSKQKKNKTVPKNLFSAAREEPSHKDLSPADSGQKKDQTMASSPKRENSSD